MHFNVNAKNVGSDEFKIRFLSFLLIDGIFFFIKLSYIKKKKATTPKIQ